MASPDAPTELDDAVVVHRIGGGVVENLRLKAREKTLPKPGISVLAEPTPGDAARRIRAAFPRATRLHTDAGTVGSTTVGQIRASGFDAIAAASSDLPCHCRIVHPSGVEGFEDGNLAALAAAFVNTTGH